MRNLSVATRRWVVLLSVLGALRVLVFAAAHPVFGFIDEALHLDVVVKFAGYGLPGRGEDHFHPEAARLIATQGENQLSPPYGSLRDRLPPAEREASIAKETQRLIGHRNAETFAPPLYYALAGLWYRAGQATGISGVFLIYWLRFLSAPLFGATILLAGLICARAWPDRPGVTVGVALVLACLPQDILYLVNSDVMSPAAVALALYLVMRWTHDESPARWLPFAAGLAAAAAVLVKYTNLPVLALVAGVIVVQLRRRRPIAQTVAFALAAAIPIALWLLRCQWEFGDWTAAKDKMAQVDWTVLPLSQSLRHPIFGPLGLLDFLRVLSVTFWRGELLWNHGVMRVAWADWFYWIVSAVGVVITAGWLLRPSPRGRATRPLALACFTVVAGSIVFLGLLSTRFDYGSFFFPSRGFPYFAAGRFLTGSIVPAVILLIGGIDELQTRRSRISAALAAAGVIAAVCLSSEMYLYLSAGSSGEARGMFQSPFNFFHLLLRRGG